MRRLLKILKWALLALLLLVVSWVAFNGPWADAPARPRPAILLQMPLQVGQPSAFAMLLPERADMPTGAPWQCGQGSGIDCTPIWFAQGAALREQMKAFAAFGATCEAASAEGTSWTEPAPKLPEKNPAAMEIPQFRNITSCMKWLRAQATLAALDGDDARILQYLRRADRAVRGSLGGAQTLIGHAIAWAMAVQQWQTVAALVHVRPQLASASLDLLRPLDPAALSTARWIANESALSHAVLRDLHRACEDVRAGTAGSGYQDWLDKLWCRARVGLLPERTVQQTDSFFQDLAEQTRDGAFAAVVNGTLQPVDPEPSTWAWSNTVGHMLMTVARPNWPPYVKRQADVELIRQAADVAVKLMIDPQPVARRQAWLEAQNMPSAIKSRISLTATTIDVKLWRDDGDKPGSISFALPEVRL